MNMKKRLQHTKMPILVALWMLSALLLTACNGNSPAETETDFGTESVTESVTEEITNASSERESDSETDTDALTDPTNETQSPPETESESESETVTETKTETQTDTETESLTETESETELETESITETETTIEPPEIPTPEDASHMIYEGFSDYTIIVGEHCAEAELNAANELQKYLATISGATLPIYRDHQVAASACEIVVGLTNRSAPESFDSVDAYHVSFKDRSLFICGGSPRGTLYGVYGFLEALGCRFFAVDTEVIPEKKTLTLNLSFDLASKPAFVYRDLFWANVYDEDISAKLGLNGALMSGPYGRELSDRVGGGISYAGPHFVHTFAFMITKETHFATHPEYFSEINGVRTAEPLYSQLCMTNPEVLELVIQHVTGWLRANPDAKIVSVSQNDSFVGTSYCTCKNCQAIIDEEGAPSGPLLRFVNAVADAIKDEFPDVYVDTLAYQYSLTPPKITKARDNVVVRFCTGACLSHPISECAQNAGIKQMVLDWKKVCPRLYIWDYTTNFAHYLCPTPNLNSIQGNAQFFYENDVIGVFEQGVYNTDGKDGEFGDLRAYLLAKLLWDPYADVEALTNEFMAAYYGDAAPYVQEYIDYLHALYKDSHLRINLSPDSFYPYFRRDIVAHFDEQWAAAKEAVKDDPKLLEHVERTEISYRYIKMQCGRGEFDPSDRKAARRAERQFQIDCQRLGVTRLSEGANVPNPVQ